jgi:hypothetical protein
MTEAVFMVYGGPNYSPPVASDEDVFTTLTEALGEWLNRRTDWTGRFPLWGDGILFPEDSIIILGTEADTFEGWTLVDAFVETGRDVEELIHYAEPAEIAAEPVSSSGASHDMQVSDALDALDEADLRAVRKSFPERLIFDGAWLDTEAMGVDPEWSSWLTDEIESTGSIQWIEGEPYLVGLEVIRPRPAVEQPPQLPFEGGV